jgi:hypothetical protein
MNLVQNTSSLAKVKPEYRQLVDVLNKRVERHFDDVLSAYYLLGSVGRGEDILGISDLDSEIVLNREVSDRDEAWTEEIKQEFEPLYPNLSGIDLGIISETELRAPQEEALKFIFKTDSVLLCSRDLIKDFPSFPPGKELARILNQKYRQNLLDIRQDILEPDEADKQNPNYLAECVRWIAKKGLRLCLGIIMFDEPFYTRRLNEMAEKFSRRYPAFKIQAKQTLQQYMQPTNDLKEALVFLDLLSQTIYKLADEKFS